MARTRRYIPGVKYHKLPGGGVSRCNATKRPCPYTAHFDSFEDAEANITPVAASVAKEDVIPFTLTVQGTTAVDEGPTLREAAEAAREKLIRTGRRPNAPLGVITTKLPAGQKLTLERETYDRLQDETVGARYKLRYFKDDCNYEQSLINLNRPMDYALLCKKIDEVYSEASDHAASLGQDDPTFDYISNYDSTMQAITDVEVLSQGAGKLYTTLGLDIFSHDIPGTLALRADYDSSSLQSYDVEDALKAHSVRDGEAQEVTVSISGAIPGGPPGARWNLNRQEDGRWYLGSVSSAFTATKELKDPEDAAKTLALVLRKNGSSEEAGKKQQAFVRQMMAEVEPKIALYEETIVALRSSKEQRLREYVERKQERKGGMGDRFSRLFD